ncbi:MAG: hypothetical protein HQ536_04085 [Parcubacteria group bacterium]|nr:hypothetical protein [Parcubacteria group bacterium]
MKEIEIVFKVIRNVVIGLFIEGVFTIIAGVLIFIYPALAGMIVGLVLMALGVVAIVIACKINKYSRLKIKI